MVTVEIKAGGTAAVTPTASEAHGEIAHEKAEARNRTADGFAHSSPSILTAPLSTGSAPTAPVVRSGDASYVEAPPSILILADQEGGARKVTPESHAGQAPDFQRMYHFIATDPAVGAMARRAAKVGGAPVTIVISGREDTSHFNTRTEQICIAWRDASKSISELRYTLMHELGHKLQQDLYENWSPAFDYRGDHHHIYKDTSQGAAWIEGFAEALAARVEPQPFVNRFAHRRRIYLSIRRPRDISQLMRVEGFVAAALLDFWGTGKEERYLAATLEVVRIADSNNDGERHDDFGEYLTEHLRRRPQDALRWEMALRAGSLGRISVSHYMNMGTEQVKAYRALGDAMDTMIDAHGPDRVGRAVWELLHRGEVPGSPQALAIAVQREVKRLVRVRRPAFENPLIAQRDWNALGDEDLAAALEDAIREKDGLFMTHSINLHPAVLEAEELVQYLQNLRARRGR